MLVGFVVGGGNVLVLIWRIVVVVRLCVEVLMVDMASVIVRARQQTTDGHWNRGQCGRHMSGEFPALQVMVAAGNVVVFLRSQLLWVY